MVCIHNAPKYLVNHEILYDIFIKYGEIKKILIFEKTKIIKSFVEFTYKDDAIKAYN